MKKIPILVPVVFLAISSSLPAQEHSVKLAPSARSTVPSAGIVKELNAQCPNVTLTLDESKSAYTFEAGGDHSEGQITRYRFTLFNREGDVAFTTSTRRLRNAVKDMCTFIKTQK